MAVVFFRSRHTCHCCWRFFRSVFFALFPYFHRINPGFLGMGLPSPPLGLRFGVGAGLGLGLPNPNPNPKPALTPNLRPKGGEGRHIPRNLDWSFSSVFLFLHQSWQSRCGVGGEARFQPTLSPPDLTHPLTVVNRIVVDEVFWIYCLRKKESKITVSTHVMCVCVCVGGGGGGGQEDVRRRRQSLGGWLAPPEISEI